MSDDAKHGWRVRYGLPAAGAWFEGHFPGNPILPGVGHLDLVRRALAEHAGAPWEFAGLTALRLRAPVGAGDEVEIELAAGAREARFVLRRAGRVASQGAVARAAGDELGPPPVAPSAAPRDDAGDLAAWLPHRPPIRCVERLLDADRDRVSCAVRLPDEGVFVRDGRLPAFFALEAAAQAAAAHDAARRGRAGRTAAPLPGYLVGAREARFSRAVLPAGATGRVALRVAGSAPPLALYAFELELGGLVAARGTIGLWLSATAA